MTLTEIINLLVVLALPIMIWIGYWMAQFGIQRMPQQQRASLEQFARLAVQYVEQNHPDAADKKALAIGFASALFASFKLPLPEASVLDIAIGSAQFEALSKRKISEVG